MTVGQRIKKRRLEIGMSADELGQRIGKSRATVYRYENDDIESKPLPIIEPMAEALMTSVAYLMGWDESADLQTRNSESLSPMENELIDMFRKTTEHGRMRIISTVLSICDEEEKNAAPADQAHTAG